MPVYIYIVSFFQRILGKNNLAIRLPSAIAGTFTVLGLMLLVNLNEKKHKFALLSGIILSIMPWHIHFSRAGFEANEALMYLTFGIYFLSVSIKKKYFLISVFIFFLLSLYTYHSAKIFLPVLIVSLIISYRKQVFLFVRKRQIFIIFSVLICIPILLNIYSVRGLSRANPVLFYNQLKTDNSKFYTNKIVQIPQEFLKNYFTNFSIDFLFFEGDGNGRHGVRETGNLYLWMLPFLIWGVITICAGAAPNQMMVIWLGVAPVAAAIATPNPHAIRSLNMTVPLAFFIAGGLVSLMGKYFRRKQNGHYFRDCFTSFAMTVLMSYFLFSYLHIYYVHYPKRTSPDWSGGIREAIETVLNHKNKYVEILITDTINKGYIYTDYYGNFLPGKRDANIRFVTSIYPHDLKKNSAYISPFWEERKEKKIKVIKNGGGDPQFYIWEN